MASDNVEKESLLEESPLAELKTSRKIEKASKDCELDAGFDSGASPLDELKRDRQLQKDKRLTSMPARTQPRTKPSPEADKDESYAEAVNRLKQLEKGKRTIPRIKRSAREDSMKEEERQSTSDDEVGPRTLERNNRAVSMPIRGPRRIESTVRANSRHPDIANAPPGERKKPSLAPLKEASAQSLTDVPNEHTADDQQEDKPFASMQPRPPRGPRRIESTVRPNARHPDLISPDGYKKFDGKQQPDRSMSVPVRGPRRIESTVRSNAAHPDFRPPSNNNDGDVGGDSAATEAARRLRLIEQHNNRQPVSNHSRTASLPVTGPRRVESTVRTPGYPDLQSPIGQKPKPRKDIEQKRASSSAAPTQTSARTSSLPARTPRPLAPGQPPRRVESTVRPNANHPDFKTVGGSKDGRKSIRGFFGRGKSRKSTESQTAKPKRAFFSIRRKKT